MGKLDKYRVGKINKERQSSILEKYRVGKVESLLPRGGGGAAWEEPTFYSENIAPFVKAGSMALFNIPRVIAKKTLPEGTYKSIFAEQVTPQGKMLNLMLGGTALVQGGPARLSLKAGKTFVPKLAQEALRRKMLRTGIEAGTFLATDLPEKPTLKGQVFRGVGGFVGGAAIPGVIGAGAATGRVLKGFRRGAGTSEYIQQEIVPKAYEAFRENIRKFTPGIKKIAKDVLHIPESAIETIERKGYDYLSKIRRDLGDTTDTIFLRIKNALDRKSELTDLAYKQAIEEIPDNAIIKINKMYNTLRRNLLKDKIIDEFNNIIPSRFQIASPAKQQLVRLLQDMEQSLVPEGKKRATGGVFKADFINYRDFLNRLYKDDPTDVLVKEVKDALLDDMAKAGYPGLKTATKLEYQKNLAIKAFSKVYKNPITKQIEYIPRFDEKKLSGFHEPKFTKEMKRQLQQLENYIGEKFIDDLEALTASRYLDKFNKYTMDNFIKDLESAVKKNKFDEVKRKYSNLLGDKAEEIFRDIITHRRAGKAIKTLKWGVPLAGAYLLKRQIGRSITPPFLKISE